MCKFDPLPSTAAQSAEDQTSIMPPASDGRICRWISRLKKPNKTRKLNNTWNLTGFWKTEGPPEDLYSARKLFWDTTLWLRDGICGGTRKMTRSDYLELKNVVKTLVFGPIVPTERKAWTMSALIELRGLSRIRTKICSSFSRLMKFPNQDLLASLQTDQWIKKQISSHVVHKHKRRTIPDNCIRIHIFITKCN